MNGLQAVTGATGHVGNALVRELLSRGVRVRAVVPDFEDRSSLQGLDLEFASADVRDCESLVRAFQDAEVVYHLAGIVSITGDCGDRLFQVNVGGTRNAAKACRKARVRRLVYTSSVHALPEPPCGVPLCETRSFDPARVLGDYARSKAEASREVLAAVAAGLDAVMLFPSGIIGPYDYRPSEMGQLMLDYCSGRLPAFVDGGYDFVDVRDVARSLVAAAERGRAGEGYLLSGHRVTVRELLGALRHLTGIRGPKVRLPIWVAQAGVPFARAWCALRHRRPLFTSYSLKVLRSNSLMDRTKAEKELGHQPRPFLDTVAATLEWFCSAGRLNLPAIPRPAR